MDFWQAFNDELTKLAIPMRQPMPQGIAANIAKNVKQYKENTKPLSKPKIYQQAELAGKMRRGLGDKAKPAVSETAGKEHLVGYKAERAKAVRESKPISPTVKQTVKKSPYVFDSAIGPEARKARTIQKTWNYSLSRD